MSWIIILLLLIKDAFVMCGMCVMFYLCKDMTLPFCYILTIFATLTAQATMVLCEFVILILSIIEDIRICSLQRKKKKWVDEYERTHNGGIVTPNKQYEDFITRSETVVDIDKLKDVFEKEQ